MVSVREGEARRGCIYVMNILKVYSKFEGRRWEI
jgi:hypothetical protein